MAEYLSYAAMSSPIGPLLVASTENGLCFIEFGQEDAAVLSLNRWQRKWLPDAKLVPDPAANAEAIRQLNEYFDGRRKAFDLPLQLYGSPFQRRVWNALLTIPYGETRSYKEIALSIAAPKAVRAIGGANHMNPVPIVVPCHRVIGSNGTLVGYGGGLRIKEYLLALEGVKSQTRTADNRNLGTR